LSSRNVRLSPEGRKDALQISKGLCAAQALYREGQRSAEVLESTVRDAINKMRAPEIDYVSVVDESTLERISEARGRARILVVARVDGVRLLDTVALSS
jgi:pantoate--beta-alanine ligase